MNLHFSCVNTELLLHNRLVAYQVKCLPQELMNTTVDYLHDDLPSLLACNLASRSWNISTQPHRSRSVVLDTEQAGRFLATFEITPRISRLVRKLTLHDSLSYSVLDRTLITTLRTASKFPNLQTLRLPDIDFIRSNEDARLVLMRDFGLIRSCPINPSFRVSNASPSNFLPFRSRILSPAAS